MPSKIDVDEVRRAHRQFGEKTPFYKDQSSIPVSVLNQLVDAGMLKRGGRKGKGFVWTENVHSLLSEVDERERRVTSMRESFRETDEPRRGLAYGARRVRRRPDSDGRPTDPDNIDQS